MKPAVQPVDAAQLIKDWAKTALMTPFPTLDVRMEHRDDWELGDNPELVVFDDSGPLDQWPVVTRPTIRVTTWTTGRDVSIVNRVLGLMLCTSIPRDCASPSRHRGHRDPRFHRRRPGVVHRPHPRTHRRSVAAARNHHPSPCGWSRTVRLPIDPRGVNRHGW